MLLIGYRQPVQATYPMVVRMVVVKNTEPIKSQFVV